MKYTIKKGKNFANFTLNRLQPFIFGRKLEGSVRFSKECWHTRGSIQYTGWNKLIGISGLLIHRNSARLVWMPDFSTPGKIMIATYVYANGKRIINPITSVHVECETGFRIEASEGLWTFSIKEKMNIIYATIPPIRLKAYPYFGGKSTAPHTMHITISRL